MTLTRLLYKVWDKLRHNQHRIVYFLIVENQAMAGMVSRNNEVSAVTVCQLFVPCSTFSLTQTWICSRQVSTRKDKYRDDIHKVFIR